LAYSSKKYLPNDKRFLITPFLSKKKPRKVWEIYIPKDLRGLFTYCYSVFTLIYFDTKNDLLDQIFLFVAAYIAIQQGPVKKNLSVIYLLMAVPLYS